MNICTFKLTKTEEEILGFLFENPTTSFRGRALAGALKRPASGVIKSARSLEKQGLVSISKDFTLSIKLNRENKETFILKRINNLGSLYECGIISFLSDVLPGAAILVFGSYARGEDTEDSDIDLAIIGYKEKEISREKLAGYEKSLHRPVQLHFFESLGGINKNLKENIIYGVILEGAIKL
jgi:predicted nucleotidyltransferase